MHGHLTFLELSGSWASSSGSLIKHPRSGVCSGQQQRQVFKAVGLRVAARLFELGLTCTRAPRGIAEARTVKSLCTASQNLRTQHSHLSHASSETACRYYGRGAYCNYWLLMRISNNKGHLMPAVDSRMPVERPSAHGNSHTQHDHHGCLKRWTGKP